MKRDFDLIVVGAGHAGCEAALAGARLGMNTALLTMRRDKVAEMSCNPAIGGTAKGILVREIDVLGGAMASIADGAGLQFRMLNRAKGRAVWSPRAQADKAAYSALMRQTVESHSHLSLLEATAEKILLEPHLAGHRAETRAGTPSVAGVRTATGEKLSCRALIVTTGTFLRGLIHRGGHQYPGGRDGEPPSVGLAHSLAEAGLELGRLKTGTPPRVAFASLQLEGLEKQLGDEDPRPFSFFTRGFAPRQLPCWITYTTPEAHAAIRNNLHRAPLYTGQIKARGPRYCPSVEDKVVRFAHRPRHQIFIEREGRDTDWTYLNGLATSLPVDVQEAVLRAIPGLEAAEVLRWGYAIEYDYVPAHQVNDTLETFAVGGLFLAGQINGTSGYEEAAGQGLLAGVNAALLLRGEPPLVLRRDEAYLGVMIDDLRTRRLTEPYRLFTSRAEFRLILRQDNADARLGPHAERLGLLSMEQRALLAARRRAATELSAMLRRLRKDGHRLEELLRRPEVSIAELRREFPELAQTPLEVAETVETELKYAGYLERQIQDVARLRAAETARIPEDFDYSRLHSLKNEARERLSHHRPATIGQASRLAGVTPADVSALLVYLKRAGKLAPP